MKFQAYVKQIRNGSDPMTAKWCASGDCVESREMCVVYAGHVAAKNLVPVKVVAYMEIGEEAEDHPQLHDKVIAYFGPEEHVVDTDWVTFLHDGDRYRVTPDGAKIEKHEQKVFTTGLPGWVGVVTYPFADLYSAASSARYAIRKND